MRFAVVVSRWNSFITERLLQGALDALRRSGCNEEDITVVRVPGAFEIPSQARTLADSKKYDAIVTLGCLIRGETTHYEHISTEVTRGIGQSAQETGVPHTYGVLTCGKPGTGAGSPWSESWGTKALKPQSQPWRW